MLDIHFYCPIVRWKIDTGIQMDQTTYERTRLNIVHVPCPHCSQTHRFLIADSLIDSPGDDDRRQLLAHGMPEILLSDGTVGHLIETAIHVASTSNIGPAARRLR